MDEQWMLDELAHAGGGHFDPSFVAGYDRKQGDAPDLAAVRDIEVLAAHGVGRDSTVIDLGAGTGRFAVAVAPHVGRLVAVDISPAMLSVLRERVAETQLTGPEGHENIETVQAGLLNYQHAGDPVDAVHTRNTLHQLPDAFKAVALHRMARMLRQGGVLRVRDLVYDTTPERFADHLEAWFGGAVDDPVIGYTRADLAEHVRSEYSTFTWLLEALLDMAGFEIIDREVRQGIYAAYTCLRR